jgi:hypothetical protein
MMLNVQILFSWNLTCGPRSNHDGPDRDTPRTCAPRRVEAHAASRMVAPGANGLAPEPSIAPMSETYFTDAGAWEFIVELIEAGHPIKQITFSHPPGKIGYVLIVGANNGGPDIYIKLQLGSGFIYGRSFHLSRYL